MMKKEGRTCLTKRFIKSGIITSSSFQDSNSLNESKSWQKYINCTVDKKSGYKMIKSSKCKKHRQASVGGLIGVPHHPESRNDAAWLPDDEGC